MPQDINAAKPSSHGKSNAPFGKIERTIAWRYLQAKKSEGGVAAVALIAFISITLAIVAMITIMSIMNGFRAKLLEITLGSQGHIYVLASDPNPTAETMADLQARLATVPGVEDVFEFSEDAAGILMSNQLTPTLVTGISKTDLEKFELISNNIEFGSLDGFGQGYGSDHQIAIGSYMAANLGVTVGDRIRLLSSRFQSSAVGTPRPVVKTYTIGAVFQTGLYATDVGTIFMDFDQAILFFAGGKRTGTIQLRLFDPDKTDALVDDVQNAVTQPVFVTTWKNKNASTATALRTEQVSMRFIFVIVVIISTFPILAAMIMLVKNKSKDIAILRTIGASRRAIMRIFFMAGSTVGILGTLMGLVLGTLLCTNIGAVQAVIEAITGQELFPADVYGLADGIPAKIVWTEVFGVALCGFIISALATFFPALNASRIDPVEALRYE